MAFTRCPQLSHSQVCIGLHSCPLEMGPLEVGVTCLGQGETSLMGTSLAHPSHFCQVMGASVEVSGGQWSPGPSTGRTSGWSTPGQQSMALSSSSSRKHIFVITNHCCWGHNLITMTLTMLWGEKEGSRRLGAVVRGEGQEAGGTWAGFPLMARRSLGFLAGRGRSSLGVPSSPTPGWVCTSRHQLEGEEA